MLDFYNITEKYAPKKKTISVSPKFIIKAESKDLMIRGRDFYAVYDPETSLWCTNEEKIISMIDRDLSAYGKTVKKHSEDDRIIYEWMWDSDSGSIDRWHKYCQKQMRDVYHQLDEKVMFQNSKCKKEDYCSKRVSYDLKAGDFSAYDELVSTLYDPEERTKLEWAIGSIIAGDSLKIQKFIVLYGSAGSGKSTVLNIIQMLFEGYYTIFDAKSLGTASNVFALESFKDNPLVGIQHDGDLSRIEDNTKLNSIISHERIEINEKFKSKYSTKINTFLFIGTNKPVRITEAKSGLIRRLIDVRPTGNKIPFKKYTELMNKIRFELGAIAKHCLDVYIGMGEDYYDSYIPQDMISATNDFYDFVEYYYDDFREKDAIALKDAWTLYRNYCDYAGVQYPFSMRSVRVELQNYFHDFKEQVMINGQHIRNYYSGFIKEKFLYEPEIAAERQVGRTDGWLDLNLSRSLLDKVLENCPAQEATAQDKPKMKWDECHTLLKDINTSFVHFVRPPMELICVDFDLKDEEGEKDLPRNIKEANKWPATYAELSKGGKGLHLYYYYTGDVTKLAKEYEEDIEIKVFTGKAALRRRVIKCNGIPISTLSSGLPLKKEKRSDMLDLKAAESEKQLRAWVKSCLKKEHHGATKPEVDFINKMLDDAYNSGLEYDLRDMRPAIMAFANNSTNQASNCLKIVANMKFSSKEKEETVPKYSSENLVFFDIEVFPNLFVVVYKEDGGAPVSLINPSPLDIEKIINFKLVGFNNRRYDNHLLYARMMGYDNMQLYNLSQRIIANSPNSTFAQAYNLSFADVYDFSSKKQSLKKFEIELGIHHQELGLPWDQEVPERLWQTVVEYCINDVIATEAVFHEREQDFIAREILSDLSGLSVNSTTQQHTAKFIFGADQNPQAQFVYTDLSTGKRTDGTKDICSFEGYMFDAGTSTYKGEITGEGGYVYAEPGVYENVALLDVESMHPNSLINLNLFGPYTKNFRDLLDARLAIKHKDFDSAKKMLNGKLSPYLESEEQAKALSYALKIVINSVYGLTSAKFASKFKDPRNKDNIVAKRGALFMVDLKEAVQQKGYTVAHIKTDSIKIPNADQEIIDFVFEFGKRYGYTFEHEATYSKFCVVNDAVYVAKDGDHWTATGTQFQVPYVFKTLFSKEPIEFKDLCETKTVTSALYLDMNEDLEEGEHDYKFVGKAGQFTPIKPGCGGGILLRQNGEKYAAATGTKGFRWLESEEVIRNHKENDADHSYYLKLVEEAKKAIEEYCDYEWFIS